MEEADLSELKPKVRRLAEDLKARAAAAGIPLIISRAFRSHAEQDALYLQGRTAGGEIVTYARGGDSYHNYGLAFDVSPAKEMGLEEKLAFRHALGPIGEKAGLEWGGRWKEFPDPAHFQYTGGYSIEELRQDVVDWSAFA